MDNVLYCDSMELTRTERGRWVWYAFSGGKLIQSGPTRYTGKRPNLASMVGAIPTVRAFPNGKQWVMPDAARDPRAWFKLPEFSCYHWDAE